MRLPRLNLPLACLTLALIVAAVLAIVSHFESVRHGAVGVAAAALAAGVCWLSCTVALIVAAATPRKSTDAVVGTLVAMSLRMGLPLIVGMVFDLSGGPLAAVGVFRLIVVFYLVTLAAETTLSLCLKERATRAS